MQTNPEDKYEVKKFCFVWLAPGMKRECVKTKMGTLQSYRL